MRTLSSLEHPLVKHLVKLRLNRDYRYEHKNVVVAGIKPVEELAKERKFKTLLAYNETFIPKNIDVENVYLVEEALMKKASGMQSPEGLLGEISMPEPAELNGKKFVLALDGINDPGNMGTLLRTALALNWDGVFILENSCDPYNDKAMRASRGASFHLPIRQGTWSELKQLIQDNQWSPWLADLTGEHPEKVTKKNGIILFLGNEAHGASPEVEALCKKVSIPMHQKTESLNVSIAGGILMYLLQGKR